MIRVSFNLLGHYIKKNVKCFDFLKCKSAFLIDFFLQAILMPDILLHFQVIWIVVNVQDFKTVLLSFQNTNLLTLIKQQLLEIFLSLNDFSAVINNRAHLYIWANNGLLLLKMFYFFQRDKDRTPEDGDKWLKPNTVRHRRASRLQAPLSHSHEVGHKYRLPLLYPSTGNKMLVLWQKTKHLLFLWMGSQYW